MLLARTLFIALLGPVFVFASDYSPDPLSVRRHGPAYRYPQAGWIVLHIEGKPYERGVQHGSLMATEIAAYCRCFAAQMGPKDPTTSWANIRRLSKAMFQHKFEDEYLLEMQGIADGASEAGATMDGRAIDLTDIVALNCWAEIESLDGGLEALPHKVDKSKLSTKPTAPAPAKAEHCSAFAATGPATADGKIVFGHITMFGLLAARHYNVWLDVKPDKGERVLMQSYPGGIQSGMDYYMSSAGLIVCETTINQTPFNVEGLTLASRIRKALQYGKSIDDVVKVLSERNNGLYTNEWLIGDTKTNEIAMFELGTNVTKLWRSSKDEWYGGTRGFYWGCNNVKDLNVRLETIADLGDRPQSTTWIPSNRDKKWLEIYEANRGKFTAESGIRAFSTPPVCAASSLDAKVTTTAMMKDLKTHAIFGPPIGGSWQPTDHEKNEFKEIVPLIPNDWTVLHPKAPPAGTTAKAADLPEKAQAFMSFGERQPHGLPHTKAAWHGTLLAKSDADLWLTEGFVTYERLFAAELSMRGDRYDGKLSDEDAERLAIEMNLHRKRILPAKANGAAADDSLLGRGAVVYSEIAKGVFRLAGIRHTLGDQKFVELMDQFGRDHAGKVVTSDQFVSFIGQHTDKQLDWHADESAAETSVKFTVRTWTEDQERSVIVYGTIADVEANREAAERLQKTIIKRGTNIIVPVLSDTQAESSLDKLKGKHVVLIGGPATNKLAKRWRESFPVSFGPGSFEVRKESYAHPGSAMIASATKPGDESASVVVVAGLSAESTTFATHFALSYFPAGNVLVVPNAARAKSLLVK